MKDNILKVEESIKKYLSQNSKYFMTSFLAGVLVYFMLMAFDLVNNWDGIWWNSNYIAGNWEISLGRGLLRYADRARFGVVSTSFNTILTLLLLSVANVLIINALEMKGKFQRYLVLILLIANPIVCNTLTYCFTAVNYGLAYLLSVLAAVCVLYSYEKKKKFKIAGCILGGILLGLSMSLYQAYICVTAVLLLFAVAKKLLEKREVKDILYYGIYAVCAIFLGGGVRT